LSSFFEFQTCIQTNKNTKVIKKHYIILYYIFLKPEKTKKKKPNETKKWKYSIYIYIIEEEEAK